MCKKSTEGLGSRLPNGEVTKRFPSVNQAMNQLNDSLLNLMNLMRKEGLPEEVRLKLEFILDHEFHYVSTAINRVSNKQKSLVSNISKILRSTSISEFPHYQWRDKS